VGQEEHSGDASIREFRAVGCGATRGDGITSYGRFYPNGVREANVRNKWMVLAGVFVLAVVAGPLGVRAGGGADDAGVRVIEVSAKKYEFSPSEIRVKVGERVRLKVHSVDETHGFKISLEPEGSKDKAVGLKFDSAEANGKVEKGVDEVLEFTAVRAGTYEFKCAKMCGMGHGKMKGRLIVE
jgi:heme/copper-type cytochrome/quinol oxidase subunit 2